MEPSTIRDRHPTRRRLAQIDGRPAAVVGVLLIGMMASSASAASKEYEVKAAFLFHFTQFVEWPDATYADADAPFCIGVLGDDPFGDALDQIVKDEAVHKHKIVIKRARDAADLKGCQILFVSDSEKDRVQQILASLNDASILTVGESDGFTRRGGIINFYLEGKKVRFEINPDAAKRCGLKISSQLLGLGRVVR